MHHSSFVLMKRLLNQYLDPHAPLKVLDVGSMNIHPNRAEGTYRQLCSDKWEYTGLDLGAGENVDVVSKLPYHWPVQMNYYDVVISGQCLEHVEAPWLWIRSVEKAIKHHGIAIIIAPWQWKEHRRPVDCWRILPDGMRYLLAGWSSFAVVECGMIGKDCYGVGRKI